MHVSNPWGGIKHSAVTYTVLKFLLFFFFFYWWIEFLVSMIAADLWKEPNLNITACSAVTSAAHSSQPIGIKKSRPKTERSLMCHSLFVILCVFVCVCLPSQSMTPACRAAAGSLRSHIMSDEDSCWSHIWCS